MQRASLSGVAARGAGAGAVPVARRVHAGHGRPPRAGGPPRGRRPDHRAQVAARRNRLAAALAPFTWSTALRVAAYSVYIPRLRYHWAAAPDIIAATCDHMAAIATTATTAGSTFATVLIYPKDAVAGGPVEIWSQSRRPGRRLAETCRTRNIEIIDLLDHIEGPADRDRYYYAQDGHLNAAGNQLIANLIAKHYLPPPATTKR